MKRRKEIIIGIALLLAFVGTIGISYAAWTVSLQQIGVNKISSTCFQITLTNEKNEINLQNAFPILKEEGKKLVPYSFTITNTCEMFASYEVTLEMLRESNMPTKYIASMINNEAIELLGSREERATTIEGAKESRVLAKGSLGSEDSEDFALRLWMDESVTIEDKDAMNTILKSKVVVTATPSTYNPVENGITTLHDAIFANEYQTSVEIAKEKIHNKQTPDFSKTAPIIDWQESHATNTIRVSTNTQNFIGTSYRFNSETGYYDILDYGTNNDYKFYTDISNEEYRSHDYYTCVGKESMNDQGIINYWRPTSCTTMYKIVSAETYQEGEETKYRITANAFTQVELESDKSDKGLYEAEDDYGTSYYYRGSVKNNNVYFANAYWQILRINGDGSIRLLYNGVESNATDTNLGIGTSAYNIQKNKPGYVGYMYGDIDASTTQEIYANENHSTIKTYLDAWYQTNIEEKGYSSYIADSGFCSDRTIVRGDGVSLDKATYFGGYQRYTKDKSPGLICPNEERDLFTANTSTKGNRALNYPVGLITVDELGMAGMSEGYINKISYVYSSNGYWTMTPMYYSSAYGARLYRFALPGNTNEVSVDVTVLLRPVISLSSDVEITGGIGTSGDPFIVLAN